MCILQFAINQLASLSFRACRKTKKKKEKKRQKTVGEATVKKIHFIRAKQAN